MNKLVITKQLEQRLRKIKDCAVAEYLLKLPETQDINYLGISKKDAGQISYIDKVKLERYGIGKKWHSKVRYCGRPGRVVQKLLPGTSDRLIEAFSNKFNATSFKVSKNKISIVYGNKIKFWYHYENYANNDYGSLACSCMKHDDCQDYFSIYTKNPDHVGMAIMVNSDNKLEARCLIWYPNTKKDKSVIYFDRIYSINDETEFKMYNWCIDKGFIQVSHKNINKPRNVPKVKITLPNLNFDLYPYVDTFLYLDSDNLNNMQSGRTLDNTDGTINENCCELCGHEDDDLSEISTGPCNGQTACSNCRSWSTHYYGYLANDYAHYCEYTDDYYLLEDIISLYNGDDCFSGYSRLTQDIHGNYFIKGDSNFVKPEGSNDWYPDGDPMIEEIDGLYYIIDSEEYKILEILNYENSND